MAAGLVEERMVEKRVALTEETKVRERWGAMEG